MRITVMNIERPTSTTWNLENFGFRFALSKDLNVINPPAELAPSHASPRPARG